MLLNRLRRPSPVHEVPALWSEYPPEPLYGGSGGSLTSMNFSKPLHFLMKTDIACRMKKFTNRWQLFFRVIIIITLLCVILIFKYNHILIHLVTASILSFDTFLHLACHQPSLRHSVILFVSFCNFGLLQCPTTRVLCPL